METVLRNENFASSANALSGVSEVMIQARGLMIFIG
jgi:hypothetical protein